MAIQVDQKTIDSIFETEGWIEKYGKIADAIYLAHPEDHDKNRSRIYPQDIVDAVRYLVDKKIILKAREILESDNSPVSIDYKIPLNSESNKQGRTVPNLHVELNRNDDSTTINGHLKYFETGQWHYFLHFHVKSEDEQEKGYLPK